MHSPKAAVYFLILCFAITLTVVFSAYLSGISLSGKSMLFSQLMIMSLMFVPGLSAIFVQKFIVKEPLKKLGFTWGKRKHYIKYFLIIALIFLLNYTITFFFFLKPDLSLSSFINTYMPGETLPFDSRYMVLIFVFITFFVAPVSNFFPSLGEELGWRGFLLNYLLPHGNRKAVVISGVIWALWHTPMIVLLGFGYGSHWAWGGLLHFVMVTSLGIWFGKIWVKTKSTLLIAFLHGVFNAHAYGFWTLIFVSENKLVIGSVGIINVCLCLIVGIISFFSLPQKNTSEVHL
jgi:membrane protease YdiL (CAAX protease family)